MVMQHFNVSALEFFEPHSNFERRLNWFDLTILSNSVHLKTNKLIKSNSLLTILIKEIVY